MNAYIRASKKDSLVTCVRAMQKGESIVVDGNEIEILEDIPVYHKVAVVDIKKGEPVYKYGEVMGVASRDIRRGEWAHVHNIESTRGRGDKG